MLRRTLTGLLFATTAVAGLHQPAAAQTGRTAPRAGPVEEIVVTARRREESLQDVPVSVSAFTGETLDLRGVPDITGLQRTTPNMTLQVARGSNSTLIAFIRGVGQQDPLWGFEPGVGLYVDDVYVARPQGAVLDIFDIERIEVLRGPQGTLYGRNTIGGAVKYVTRRIGNESELRLKTNIGTDGQRDLIVSGGLPLVENKLSIGGAFALYTRDGYGENLFSGADHYDKDVGAGRLALELTPTETTFFRLSYDRTEDGSNAKHGHRLTPLPGGSAPVLDDVFDTRAGAGDDNSVKNDGLSLLGEWQATDTITLKSITAYRQGDTDTLIDFDSTPGPILDVPAFYKDDQFSQELQLLYQGAGWQGVFGLYYLDANASGAFDTVLGNLGLTILTAGEVKTESYAAFADVSFDLTDQLSASVGLRYTLDEKEGTVFRANYAGIRSPEFGGIAQPPALIRTDYTNDRDFDEFTPRFSLTWQPTADLTAYASYSRGFKSGGFDMRGDAVLTPNTVNGYDPETVDSYEIGLKGQYFERLTLNLAGFYSKYDGQQITTQVPATSGIASFVDNVGSSEIYGFEAEGNLSVTDALSASFVLGYTHAEFDEFLTYDITTGQFVDVSDQRVFQNTPEWNAAVILTYLHDMGERGSLTFSGSAAFRDDASMFEIPSPLLDQDAYTLFDASIVWTSDDERWRVGLHGRNLTDKEYKVGGYSFPGALYGDSITAFYGPPRTITGTVEVRF
ncbi:TonB-dependent receptor [Rhodospirillum centenum]|nr:TonB-dependent receptor [Rhodospirillum centenum]